MNKHEAGGTRPQDFAHLVMGRGQVPPALFLVPATDGTGKCACYFLAVSICLPNVLNNNDLERIADVCPSHWDKH